MPRFRLPLFSILLLLVAVPTVAEGAPDLAAAAKAAGTVNGLCPVLQRPVTPGGGSGDYAGEKVGFCCPPCAEKFAADPVRYMNRMRLNPGKYAYTSKHPTLAVMKQAAAVAGSANGLCPVMRRPVTVKGGSVTVRDQKIAFCCPPCIEKFEADPERYLRAMRADPLAYAYDRPGPTHAQLRLARESAGTVNGLCPVMKRLVVPGGGFHIHGEEKVGFCCPPCEENFRADPDGFLEKMRAEPAVYGYLPAN